MYDTFDRKRDVILLIKFIFVKRCCPQHDEHLSLLHWIDCLNIDIDKLSIFLSCGHI